MNYPTKEYQTYADCDQDYVRRTLPSDLVPFWNADNISQASSFWESENKEIYEKTIMDSGLNVKELNSTILRSSEEAHPEVWISIIHMT